MDVIIILLVMVGLIVMLTRAILRPRRESQATSEPEATPRPTPSRSQPPPPHTPQIIVGPAFVLDGDTIVIDNKSIRLFGIDAPELDHPYGRKAKGALIRMCKGQRVRAEVSGLDDHGRWAARCTLADGRDLSGEMVKQGLALDWAKFSGGRYRHLEAADARKRLWLADARQKGRMEVWRSYVARSPDLP